MAIERTRIERAKAFVQRDERGFFTTNRFDLLSSLIRTTIAMQGGAVDPKVVKTHSSLQFIEQDFRNLLTIYAKVDWIFKQHSEGHLNEADASLYLATDIDMFHVEFRSLFDYLAAAVHSIAIAPAEVSANNFGTLLALTRNVTKPRVRPSLGGDLADLLATCDWFEQLQGVRDKVVHQGGFTLVFPAQNGVNDPLFQSYAPVGGDPLVALPEVMFNDTIVNFSLYGALHIAYLIVLLDEFADIARQRLPLAPIRLEPRHYHPAWQIIIPRFDQLLP